MPRNTAANSLTTVFYHVHRHIWSSFLFLLVLLSYVMLWLNVAPQMHCSGLAWHPEVATQMVLASEDDRLPVIQMWDLRFASSPLRVLESHTRYEPYIAWCAPWCLHCWWPSRFVHLTSCCPLWRKAWLRGQFQQQAVLYGGLWTSQPCVMKDLPFWSLVLRREQAPKLNN